jgi:hypothetical protein
MEESKLVIRPTGQEGIVMFARCKKLLPAAYRLSLVILLISFASLSALAKGLPSKITIENSKFDRPIVITDSEITHKFSVFAGPGTSGNEPRSLIMDWAGGAVTPPPSELETYRVSFYVDGYALPYVVLYAFNSSKKQGYVYLPGKGEESYRQNVSMIIRGVEGHWFRALPLWEDVATPLIQRQLALSRQ